MTEPVVTEPRASGRALPMLESAPPPTVLGRAAAVAEDDRLGEYRPDSPSLPRFALWTLGCQMNRSDSEEMAGRLLAAGCDEATGFETADLIVINTCAIREAAEQKVIGRQGQLAELKVANPGLRVVLTGCSVREPDRAGLRRRYPAVDLFLRPDEEPELIDRLGLASAQASVGLGPAAWARRRTTGATTRVGRNVVGAADHLAASRSAALEGGAVRRESPTSAPGCRSSTAATRPAPTASCRSAAGRNGAGRSTRSSTRLARLAAAGYREVTLLGQNVNSYGHDLPAEARFGHIAPERCGRAGTRTCAAGPTWPRCSGRSTGSGRPTACRPSRGCAS